MITIAMLWTLLVLRLPFLALVNGSAYTGSSNDLKETDNIEEMREKNWNLLNKMFEKAGSKSPPRLLLDDDSDDDEEDDNNVEEFFKDDISFNLDEREDPILLQGLDLTDDQKTQFYHDFRNYNVDLNDSFQRDSGLVFSNKDYQGLESDGYVGEEHISIQRGKSAIIAEKKHENSMDAVMALLTRVKKEGSCRHPKPKLIPVKSIYRYTFKQYLPHCVILHQCSADIACCDNNSEACGPVESKIQPVNVTLYVFGAYDTGEPNLFETLTFYNHTECTCLQRIDLMDEDFSKRDFVRSIVTEPKTEAPTVHNRCECPKHFSDIIRNSTCVCDCLHGHRVCLRLKRGIEHFGMAERSRIEQGSCLEPECEYGPYNRSSGQCAKKKEFISKSKEEYN